MEQTIDFIFKALADPTRREILVMLSGRVLPAGRIADQFPQQRPAISKHLTILKRAGLIIERRNAQQRLYSVGTSAVDEAVNKLQVLQNSQIAHPVVPKFVAEIETPARREVFETRRSPVDDLIPPPFRMLSPSLDLEFD